MKRLAWEHNVWWLLMYYFAVWAASVIQQNLTQIVHVLDSHCIYKAKVNVRRKHQKMLFNLLLHQWDAVIDRTQPDTYSKGWRSVSLSKN